MSRRLHRRASGFAALLAECLVLAGCTGPTRVRKADLDQAAQLGETGEHAQAEAALRALLVPGAQGQALHAESALMVRSRLVPLLEAQGRLGEAVELAQSTYQEWRRTQGERGPNSITALANLGRLYASLGRMQLALEAQERSTRLSIEVLGSWHDVAVASRNNLAATYLKLGRADEAVRLQEAAVDASRRSRGEDDPRTLAATTALARTYLAARRPADARLAAERALSGLGDRAESANPTALAARAYRVAALRAGGDDRLALPLQEQLLADTLRALPPGHRFTLDQRAAMARLLAGQGQRQAALEQAGPFVDGAERLRAQPGLARDDRRALFAGYAEQYRFFSALMGAAGELHAGLRLSELSKARTLLESMSEQSASRSRVLPEPDQRALAALEQALLEHEKAISESADIARRGGRILRRDADLRRYEALVTQLKAQHPKFAQLRDPRIVTAAELPGLVPPQGVFVSYILHDDRAGAWTVDDLGAVRFHDLGELPHLADAVEALRLSASHLGGIRQLPARDRLRAWRTPEGHYRLLDARARPPAGSVLVRDEAELADYLGQRLLAPLRAVLAARPRWVVAPDGVLARLPFELLPFGRGRVLEQVELHLAQSLSIYAMARAQQQAYQGLPRERDLLALGDPVYGAADAPARDAPRGRARKAPSVHSEHQLRETRLLWDPLPGTATEVRQLQRLFPGSDVYLGPDASEATLRRLHAGGGLRRYRYLHFAVHGHLSAEDPSLSSLVLSQVDLDDGTDGYVTAAEWPAFDLRSDLTVLSACDTGLGQNVSGEGVMGLPFALFVAGNVNTVVTLWPVLDAVAPVFMERFFARLRAGEPAARALSATKREMAADPRTRHPANWAPFVLVGAG